jgi:serine/threonine protein phosphatase PrpC
VLIILDTTYNLIIHVGHHILCANVGNYRSLVVYNNNEDQELKYLEQVQLSIYYKTDIEEEKNRILLSGGFVEQMKNELGKGVGPYRVWAKSQDYAGLAMSRSIGNLKVKAVGIIAVPGILEYDLKEKTKFIVIASDGV